MRLPDASEIGGLLAPVYARIRGIAADLSAWNTLAGLAQVIVEKRLHDGLGLELPAPGVFPPTLDRIRDSASRLAANAVLKAVSESQAHEAVQQGLVVPACRSFAAELARIRTGAEGVSAQATLMAADDLLAQNRLAAGLLLPPIVPLADSTLLIRRKAEELSAQATLVGLEDILVRSRLAWGLRLRRVAPLAKPVMRIREIASGLAAAPTLWDLGRMLRKHRATEVRVIQELAWRAISAMLRDTADDRATRQRLYAICRTVPPLHEALTNYFASIRKKENTHVSNPATRTTPGTGTSHSPSHLGTPGDNVGGEPFRLESPGGDAASQIVGPKA